nr:hypothetical protein [Tanacetum cinerariifolium]
MSDERVFCRPFSEKSPIAIAPVLPTEELENSLSMRDEHLSTISKIESDKVIKSSVEDLVPIPSESEGILDNMCDVPLVIKITFDVESDLIESLLTRDTSIVYSLKIDSFLEEFAGELVHIDLIPPGINETDSGHKDDIRFIEQLLYDDTSSEDHSFEDFDYVEASPPEEMSSDSTTTHADNSPPKYDSFLFKIEPDQGELASVVIEVILREPHVHVSNELPTDPTLYQDSKFSSFNDSLGSGLEVSFPSRTRNKIFDPGIFFEVQSERFLSHDTFSSNILESPFLFSSRSEDIIFDPDISVFLFFFSRSGGI